MDLNQVLPPITLYQVQREVMTLSYLAKDRHSLLAVTR